MMKRTVDALSDPTNVRGKLLDGNPHAAPFITIGAEMLCEKIETEMRQGSHLKARDGSVADPSLTDVTDAHAPRRCRSRSYQRSALQREQDPPLARTPSWVQAFRFLLAHQRGLGWKT